MIRLLRAGSLLIPLLAFPSLKGAAPIQESQPTPSAVARDAKAMANAKRLNRAMAAAYRRAMRAGVEVQDGAYLWAILSTRLRPLPGPAAPWTSTGRNPWEGTGAAPTLAISQNIVALADAEPMTIREMAQAANLGQAIGAFLPRDPTTGRAPVVATAVYLQVPRRGQGGPSNHVFFQITSIDESAHDRAVLALVSRLHRQVRRRFNRVRAAGLSVSNGAELQLRLFGRGPTSTELPDYWTRRNPWRLGTPAINPIVLDVSSSKGNDVDGLAGVSTLGQIQMGYVAPGGQGPAAFVTAVYLFKPFRDPQGHETHVFSKVSRLE